MERATVNHEQDLTPTGDRADGSEGLVVNENGRVPQAESTMRNYESILYAFYNKELTIEETEMSAALANCGQLLGISDYLGCTSMISRHVEIALLKHGQDLFRAIQGAPFAWAEMADRIRSELIFKECVIHLVGNWNNVGDKEERLQYAHYMRNIVNKYHPELIGKVKALEVGVLSHYPEAMRLPSEDRPVKRESYAKDILVWMALTFFRHWFSQRLVMGKGRDAPDCGYGLFAVLGVGGDAYMDKSITNQFHAHFPITKKAMNVLENRLHEFKECIKKVVDDSKLLHSQCQLDVHRFPVNYFTCTEFDRKDFPWLQEDAQARLVPAKRAYKPGGNEIARLNLETARRYQGSSLERQDESGYVGDDDEDDLDSPYDRDMNKRVRYQ